jgi:hypothetical protein
MPSPEAIFAIIVFSIIGLAAFRAGKRDSEWKPMILGVSLMIYPYFITNVWWLWVIGGLLTVGWFVCRE